MDEEYQRMAANSIAHEAFCAGQAWQHAAAAQERPCVLWKPSLYRDGNQWCALLGENIQDGVVGFGDSPDAAMWAFDEAWCEKLPPAPGAQPAPSEKDEPIRKAWARFKNELHRSPDALYPGMSEAFEKHFSQSFTDREWRAESATWAAAWKAAKRHEAQAQPAPSIPDGWLRAIDEALVVAHIGVANESDTYEQAKAKLDSLIGFNVDIATDPAVNGGYKLVSVD